MKKCILLLATFTSLNAFAQRSSIACSPEVLSGPWMSIYSSSPKIQNIVSIDLKKSQNPLVMDFKHYDIKSQKLVFVHKSIYSTAVLNQKTCVITAHLTETQSLSIDESGEIDGTSDYNEADQIQQIKIEILSNKKIRLTNCAKDLSCTEASTEIYEKQ